MANIECNRASQAGGKDCRDTKHICLVQEGDTEGKSEKLITKGGWGAYHKTEEKQSHL